MSHPKDGKSDFAVQPMFTERWSPYLFDGKGVAKNLLQQCFEAARWSASSFNEQPWVFIVAHREDEASFQKMLGCLLEANQVWAKHAGVLVIAVSKENFTHNGTPNRVHQYDLGQAVAQFVLQATVLNLASHQMAGINVSRIRQEYSIPEGYAPQTAIAVGYATDKVAAGLEGIAERDKSTRQRKPVSSFVFTGQWGASF